MKSQERAAFTRVLIDLIKADKVIDSREMQLYNRLKEQYSITREDQIKAYDMTLGQSVELLRYLPADELASMMRIFADMTMSDGFCAREEALLMTMLKMCLESDTPPCDVLSYEIEESWFDERQVLYIESHHDKAANYYISHNFRTISRELKLCGLEFVYLPHILHHYVSTPKAMLRDVVAMLSPTLKEDDVNGLLNKIRLFKTDTFCIEQLHHKLHFDHLADTPPALMLRVSQSRVRNKVFTNFLRISIESPEDEQQILQAVLTFVDTFLSYNGSDRIVISHKRDEAGSFLYSGFYRQLFEVLLLQKAEECHMLIDTVSGEFSFKEIDLRLTGINRKEKAFYVLFIYEAWRNARRVEGVVKQNGGIRFAPPVIESQMEKYQKRMDLLQRRYARIYAEFGGEPADAPDIRRADLRNPMLSVIKRVINKIADRIYEPERFIISRVGKEYYIQAPLELFLFMNYDLSKTSKPEPVSILLSTLFENLDAMK